MWDDIIIGTGEKGNSAIRIFNKEVDNISENRRSYWISDCMLDLGITVLKDTEEGINIKTLLDCNRSKEHIQDYIDSIILKNISIELLKIKIDESNKEHYRSGQEAKIKEIKKTLNM